MNEDIAAGTIMRELHRRAFVLPRYTPPKWWECDVFELTATGYFREYEIKLTLADFKADAKKSRDIRGTWQQVEVEPGRSWKWVADQEHKHQLLASGCTRGPKEFYFVSTPGLIDVGILPPWAGLIELHDRGEGHRPTWRYSMVTVVRAPRLHNEKADPKLRTDALGVCYYRLHAAYDRIRDRNEPSATWKDEPPPACGHPDNVDATAAPILS